MRARPSKRGNEDVVAGLFFIACGIAGLWFGRNLNVGNASEMGEGFFPVIMSVALVGLGVTIAVTSIWRDVRIERIAWRAPLLVTLAVLAFAMSIETLGVVIAVALCVVIASFAGSMPRAGKVLALAAILAVVVLAVFVWGLGLPLRAMPAWPH
jgi:Tripartite tricarboxylate transporter TctB family